MPYSDCCEAYTDMEEFGICPLCKEHCDFHDISFDHDGEILVSEEGETPNS